MLGMLMPALIGYSAARLPVALLSTKSRPALTATDPFKSSLLKLPLIPAPISGTVIVPDVPVANMSWPVVLKSSVPEVADTVGAVDMFRSDLGSPRARTGREAARGARGEGHHPSQTGPRLIRLI